MKTPRSTPYFKRWDTELLQYVLILVGGGAFQELIIEGGISHPEHITIKEILLNGSFWLALWKGNEYLVVFLDVQGIHWNDHPVKRFIYAFILTIAYVFLAVLIILHLFFYVFGDWTLSQLWGMIDFGDFVMPLAITLAISTFMHGRGFLIEWRNAAVAMEQLKSETLKTQYESLKNQVNPHFLFNSLNVLSELVYEDQAKAVDFIRMMSNVYRYVLENKDQELVPLREELRFLNSYAYLQKIRFGDNLQLEIDEQKGEGMVPPLALQMLLENAIKHNVISDTKPLKVTVRIDRNQIIVRNKKQEKLSKDSTGIGLDNLRARYGYLTERPVRVQESDANFEVIIPLLENVQ